MTKRQILEKAIKQAVAGGWLPFEFGTPTEITQWDDEGMITIAVLFPLHEEPTAWIRELEGIIYNHDFAKALWGYDEYKTTYTGTMGSGYSLQPAWMVHMYNMVTQPDPIQYLKETLK